MEKFGYAYDMRQANRAIIRRYPIPTVDEVLHTVNGSKVFSKVDLKWGYHQLELSPKSREITTFATPDGLFRYKRLLFGVFFFLLVNNISMR